uniref:Hypoxia-inducible factor 1-alpha-like isoform X2 n=1 Tax=Petromyzon marinus TaxID=7757 RepID=A0AAJ7TQC9_PETMA|nr:hypoxia-inducible factor 1-alpha-like isoform X2 [Petromyzon marinus]
MGPSGARLHHRSSRFGVPARAWLEKSRRFFAVYSERRKEKSRDAARCRRGWETEVFAQLARELPLPPAASAALDKASVMRLAISYLRLRQLLPPNRLSRCDAAAAAAAVEEVEEDHAGESGSSLDALTLRALEGFVMVLSSEGDMTYLSDNVGKHLGLPQVEMTGNSIFEFVHPCDQEELREVLAQKRGAARKGADAGTERDFFVRMKCTITSRGKTVNLKSATWKVLHCTGHMRVCGDPSGSFPEGMEQQQQQRQQHQQHQQQQQLHHHHHQQQQQQASPRAFLGAPSVSRASSIPAANCLVLLCSPIPHPASIETPLDSRTFLTRHAMDMKFTYCDERITDLIGYHPKELLGRSVYEYYHALDTERVTKSHHHLFGKGQATTGHYRMLAKRGGFAWVETQATVIYSPRNAQPQCVVCVNYVLSGVEETGTVLSLEQTERLLKTRPGDSSPPSSPCANLGGIVGAATMGESLFIKLKEEPDELALIAPTAGDEVISLNFGLGHRCGGGGGLQHPPSYSDLSLYDDVALPSPERGDREPPLGLPLTPPMAAQREPCPPRDSASAAFFCDARVPQPSANRRQDGAGKTRSASEESFSPLGGDLRIDTIEKLFSVSPETKALPPTQEFGSDLDLETVAPYIPMDGEDFLLCIPESAPGFYSDSPLPKSPPGATGPPGTPATPRHLHSGIFQPPEFQQPLRTLAARSPISQHAPLPEISFRLDEFGVFGLNRLEETRHGKSPPSPATAAGAAATAPSAWVPSTLTAKRPKLDSPRAAVPPRMGANAPSRMLPLAYPAPHQQQHQQQQAYAPRPSDGAHYVEMPGSLARFSGPFMAHVVAATAAASCRKRRLSNEGAVSPMNLATYAQQPGLGASLAVQPEPYAGRACGLPAHGDSRWSGDCATDKLAGPGRGRQALCRKPATDVASRLLAGGSSLPELTRYDCEVNAPVVDCRRLLQGVELLRALDQTT